MAVPKRKHSKARSRKRRGGHMKLSAVKSLPCPKCGELMIPHHVCPSCGHYRGKDVMHLEDED